MPYEYKVKNIGSFKKWMVMEKKLNDLGNDDWELINFKVNDNKEKNITAIFKKTT